MKLFTKTEEYINKKGIKVTIFKPNIEIYIDSINLKTKEIEEKLVTEFSKHENLELYKVHDYKKRFKDLWVSTDHSLVVENKKEDCLEKISPLQILKNINNYSFIQKCNSSYKLIPCSEIDFSIDPDKTIAYDLTVEDNYTFCTDDGLFIQDTMRIYVPVTEEAIEEAKEKMIVSKSKDSMTGISDDFSKDIVIGLYTLTQNTKSDKTPLNLRDDSELEKLSPLTKIKYDGKITTAGKVIFNKITPSKKYRTEDPVTRKKINQLTSDIYNEYGETDKEKYVKFCDDAVKLGTKYYSIMAPSFTMDDMIDIPKSILKLKKELDQSDNSEDSNAIINKMTKKLQEYLENNNTNIGVIGQAGGLKGGYSQARQILVSKGLISAPDGGVKTIKNSYSDGLDPEEYFESGYGSRKGIIDRVLNTGDTGYLSRQLVFALQRVEADPTIINCKTKKFVTLKVTKDLAKRLNGRYLINDDKKIEKFDPKKHMDKVIHLRSPIYCKTHNICKTCYGDLLFRNKTRYVGMLAGEICGERLTQTIMRTFHVGGSVTIKTVNIIEELSRILAESEKRILKNNFKQEKSDLVSLTDGKLIINRSDYLEPKKDISVTNDQIKLNYGYFKLKYNAVDANATIDNKILVDLKDKEMTDVEGIITIKYPKNSIVFNCIPTNEAFSEQVKIIETLFSGKAPYKNADHFLMKIYDQYLTLSTDADLVHLEILASNLLRDKGNPSYPARLNPDYDGVVMPLKSISQLESWLQAFAFENPKASLTSGLIYDRPTDETILEKIITGDF